MEKWGSVLYVIWLGASLALFCDLTLLDWEAYVIVIPVIVFVNLFNERKMR